MKIASANLQLSASQQSFQQHTVAESLRVTVGARSAVTAQAQNLAQGEPAKKERLVDKLNDNDLVRLSEQGKKASRRDVSAEKSNAIQSGEDVVNNDPRLKLLVAILEKLTGQKIKLLDAKDFASAKSADTATAASTTAAASTTGSESQPPAAPSSGFSAVYQRTEVYAESETMNFAASGKVLTADGKEINFNLKMEMSRSFYRESSETLQMGDAAKTTDPLVINFGGNATELLDQRFSFDLNSDGQKESINRLASGSGFLVFDKNGDGKVNNGSELFGPTLGNGFDELATLDSDGNGWIDENDEAWSKLGVWTPNADGSNSFVSLLDANVGALALSYVNSPFSIKNTNNDLLGQVRATGIFLQESGGTGTIQQIDLSV